MQTVGITRFQNITQDILWEENTGHVYLTDRHVGRAENAADAERVGLYFVRFNEKLDLIANPELISSPR